MAVAEGADDSPHGPTKNVGFYDDGDEGQTSVSGRSSMSRSTMSSAWSSKSRDEEKDWTNEITSLLQSSAVKALGRSASGRLPGAEPHGPVRRDPHSGSESEEEWGWGCGGTSSQEEDVWIPGYVSAHMAQHMLQRQMWDGKEPRKEGEEEGEAGQGSQPASPSKEGKGAANTPGTPNSRQGSKRGFGMSSSMRSGSLGKSRGAQLAKSVSMHSSRGSDDGGTGSEPYESECTSEGDGSCVRVVYVPEWSGLNAWSAALEPMREGAKRWRLRLAAAPENWRFRKPRPGLVRGSAGGRYWGGGCMRGDHI